ncbi:hypothetical protein GOODEAATRI_024272, partial [Goodea atripinnis]
RLYAMQRGMKLDSKTPDCRKFLIKLMDQLETVSSPPLCEESHQGCQAKIVCCLMHAGLIKAVASSLPALVSEALTEPVENHLLKAGFHTKAQTAVRHTAILLDTEMKKELSDNESITEEVVGNAHIDNYVSKVFSYADKEDRAGRFHK